MKIWKLELLDGTSIELPEASAMLVKQSLARGDKFISIGERTVATHQVKTLDKTSAEDTEGKILLGEGVNAFKGKINEYADSKGYRLISAVKVKKEVSQKDFTSYYGKHPAYEKVPGDGTWVSFWIAKDLGIPAGCEVL